MAQVADKQPNQISKSKHGGPRPNSGGLRPGAGRKPGVPNKISGDVKAMILAALDEKGGKQYLVEQAERNPTAFMALLGKILPTQLSGDPDNPLQVHQVIEQVIVDSPKGRGS
jgi:hypothetical protein